MSRPTESEQRQAIAETARELREGAGRHMTQEQAEARVRQAVVRGERERENGNR